MKNFCLHFFFLEEFNHKSHKTMSSLKSLANYAVLKAQLFRADAQEIVYWIF